jgi:hypothetical protein
MHDAIFAAIGRIPTKLAQARSGNYRCFGSKQHGFRLNPYRGQVVYVDVEGRRHT